ncbi:MAG: GNAT family N-acetyltransferase [Parachlamydiaceae bacterium]|nr:GNAT family N-acetyltransferase [Parachlamydiaceae bacterium]
MITIRQAEESDTSQLEELFLISRQQTFTWEDPNKFKMEDYRKATEGETIFIAENDTGKILGFISVWEHDAFPFIHHLFISPEYLRKGIGKALLNSLFTWLPFPYRLKCIAKNQNALKFYLKNNWKEIDHGVSEDGDFFLLELSSLPASSKETLQASHTHFDFKPVGKENRQLVRAWLVQPYVAEWFYGDGLQNTFNHLDEFLEGASQSQYWLAYDNDRPFAFFITSAVSKPGDELTHWCAEEGLAITLDMLIGDISYLGKGLSPILIREFLLSQFPKAAEVLIDPEKTNARAVHVYQKVGFNILDEFIPSHSPNPHYMMRLSMKKLIVSPEKRIEKKE